MAARRTTLANLIRVESRGSHGDRYSFPTSVPFCAHEEAPTDPSGRPLERPSSHPATVISLWPRLAMCLFGRKGFELNHAGDKRLAPSTKIFFPQKIGGECEVQPNPKFSSQAKPCAALGRGLPRGDMGLDVFSEDGCSCDLHMVSLPAATVRFFWEYSPGWAVCCSLRICAVS